MVIEIFTGRGNARDKKGEIKSRDTEKWLLVCPETVRNQHV